MALIGDYSNLQSQLVLSGDVWDDRDAVRGSKQQERGERRQDRGEAGKQLTTTTSGDFPLFSEIYYL